MEKYHPSRNWFVLTCINLLTIKHVDSIIGFGFHDAEQVHAFGDQVRRVRSRDPPVLATGTVSLHCCLDAKGWIKTCLVGSSSFIIFIFDICSLTFFEYFTGIGKWERHSYRCT